MGRDKLLRSYLVQCDKTLVTACDFNLNYLGNWAQDMQALDAMHVMLPLFNLETGITVCSHGGCLYEAICSIILRKDKLLCS